MKTLTGVVLALLPFLPACASSSPSSPTPVVATSVNADAGGSPPSRRQASTERTRCLVSVTPASSPFCTERQPVGQVCNDDSTRWVRVSLEGACRASEPTWSITPLAHGRQAEVFPWHLDSGLAFVRGECGPYTVSVTIGSGDSGSVQVNLPGGEAPECEVQQ